MTFALLQAFASGTVARSYQLQPWSQIALDDRLCPSRKATMRSSSRRTSMDQQKQPHDLQSNQISRLLVLVHCPTLSLRLLSPL
jgi:hypothetical protein